MDQQAMHYCQYWSRPRIWIVSFFGPRFHFSVIAWSIFGLRPKYSWYRSWRRTASPRGHAAKPMQSSWLHTQLAALLASFGFWSCMSGQQLLDGSPGTHTHTKRMGGSLWAQLAREVQMGAAYVVAGLRLRFVHINWFSILYRTHENICKLRTSVNTQCHCDPTHEPKWWQIKRTCAFSLGRRQNGLKGVRKTRIMRFH